MKCARLDQVLPAFFAMTSRDVLLVVPAKVTQLAAAGRRVMFNFTQRLKGKRYA
jgi:hypothetical protein